MALLGLGLATTGCSEKVMTTEPLPRFPETELTFGPLESDTTSVKVRFFWYGYDKDGEVVRFRFAMDADTALPKNQWQSTTSKDTTFRFTVDPAKAILLHVFMVSAEDNDGNIDPTPARRFFSTKTIPPTSCIVRGPSPFNPDVGPHFTFEWSGTDPDGSETGGEAPVDSFEFLLLKIGAIADSTVPAAHQPLPIFNQTSYVDLINRATGNSLPEPHSDWKWIGVRGTLRRFRNVAQGEYVFAVRAVDRDGARERNLRFGCNIRRVTTSTRTPGPTLTVCSSVLNNCLAPTRGPVDAQRSPLEVLEGETISFSWIATADVYGGRIVGYTYALDDSTSFPAFDLLRTGATFIQGQLPSGIHILYVRVIDDEGVVTNAVIPILVIRPAFKEPGAPRAILYVDDSLGPGSAPMRIGNFPSDVEETNWWFDLLFNLGVPVNEWDTRLAGAADIEGRKAPGLRDLAHYSTVIWNVDFNNGASLTTATGLWKTLVGGAYSDLGGYLRAGGTLILTGFAIGSSVVRPSTTLYTYFTSGICSALEPGSTMHKLAFFPRLMMGVDGAHASSQGLRTLGARDFIEAWPTSEGIAAGYDSAFVDRGDSGSGAKWITSFAGDPNFNRSPGLPQVDGWNLAQNFGCEPSFTFRLEDHSRPIAEVILRYHGVNMGVDEEGPPSPREGFAVGVRVQAHDLGNQWGGVLTPGNTAGAVGRTVHLAFPVYFLKDADALRVIQTSFDYVNGSPTLP